MKLTRRGKWVLTVLVLSLFVIVPLSGFVFLGNIGVVGASSPGEKVRFEVPEGANIAEIGRLLEERGVIDSALGFRIAAYLESGSESIQAGRYEIRTGLTARDALGVLLEGPKIEFVTVTFPEGSWLVDFADRLERDTHISGRKFLDVLEGGEVESSLLPNGSSNFEGLLFPSTYQIVEDDTAATVAQRLVDEMEKQLEAVGTSSAEATGVSKYELLIVASMVQAEAGVDEDRGKIARVIYNRLQRDMPLGIDATIIYALGEHKTSLTPADLEVDSPYNTRKVGGLPPTPIGASGAASLEAAAHPPPGDWLYYVVSDCEGHHAFSTNYDDFLADKADYQALDC